MLATPMQPRRVKKRRVLTEPARDWIARMLVDRVPPNRIKKRIARRYKIHIPHRLKMMIEEARQWIKFLTKQPTTWHILKSYTFYMSIIDNKKEKTKDRIEARKACDRLLGLITHQFKHSGTITRKHEVEPETMEVLRAQYGNIYKQLSVTYQPSGLDSDAGEVCNGDRGHDTPEPVPPPVQPEGGAVEIDSEASAVLGL